MVDYTKEFTLMFYFASDNTLAISVVSQLKAIKAAGFHEDANVIVQFDPFTEGTPTHIFDVNMVNKLKSNGKCEALNTQPLVLNLIDDKLWNGERTRDGEFISKAMRDYVAGYDPPHPPNGREVIDGKSYEFGPQRSLDRFLEFCSYAYPAKHYLLFILGHGVVVGNDVFLFDETGDENSLKLGTLGSVLKKFSDDVKLGGGQFDLVGFHSCSVSSIEVAYELKDTARYMIASQGTAFVGSWPYKQMLQHVFDELKRLEKENRRRRKEKGSTYVTEKTIRTMLVDMFSFCMQNSTDFLLAGYPFDLSLFDLSKISTIKEPVDELSRALLEALKDAHCTDLIVLAHWKSQSFYQEMYTDLYDFCFCLKQKLEDYRPLAKGAADLLLACEHVITALEKNTEIKRNSKGEEFLMCSEFAGPEYQYAHGLSVYFPWSRPPADRRIGEEYKEYKISGSEFKTPWLKFLEAYWEATMRETRKTELNAGALQGESALFEDRISLVYTQEGPRDGSNALDSRAKIDPKDPTGGDSYGFTIKNFPNDIRVRQQTTREENPFSLSEAFLPRSGP
jgi:hypothetical protein